METVAVIDFETTGLSPTQGDRATEIGVVIMKNGKIVDRYDSLMYAGAHIPAYIESLTGITNAMIRKAPPASKVMREVFDFVGDYPLVAHNASFDRRFWDAELDRIRLQRRQEFICSLLLSRRIFPFAPSHSLGNLITYTQLPVTGQYHRALADAEMAASLLNRLVEELHGPHRVTHVSVDLLRRIQQTPKSQLAACLARL